MVKISKEKMEIDFSILEEYCKAVDKSIIGFDTTFITYTDGTVTFYSEDKHDGMNVGSSVFLEVPVEGSAPPFSAGIETERFLALVKKLYEGSITLDFSKNKVVVKEDNIKASFAKIAGKKYYTVPKFVELTGTNKEWIIDRLADCTSSISETTKKKSDNKFVGILFDTSNAVSRVCKFSTVSLYLSTTSAIFANDFRVVFPDILARIAKSFSGSIKALMLADNVVGLELESGTKIWTPKPVDSYPHDYLSHLGMSKELRLLPEKDPYTFDVNALINSIDLVSVVLGATDSWVSLATIGKKEDSMVWRVSGKNYKNTEIHEDVLSTDGSVVEKFGINKDRALKALTLFKDNVRMHNLNASVLGFSDVEGDRVALLVKTRV